MLSKRAYHIRGVDGVQIRKSLVKISSRGKLHPSFLYGVRAWQEPLLIDRNHLEHTVKRKHCPREQRISTNSETTDAG